MYSAELFIYKGALVHGQVHVGCIGGCKPELLYKLDDQNQAKEH